MKFENFPNGIRDLILCRARESKWPPSSNLPESFNFYSTLEGYDFWEAIALGKFSVYSNKYPNHEWIKDYPYKYAIMDDNYLVDLEEVELTSDLLHNNSSGIKVEDGKVDYSEINFDILDLMAQRFKDNKHNYPKDNMKKPIEISKLLWPLFRHWKKMMWPKEDDPEKFEDHLAAIMCNCSMILDQLKISKNVNN